jgi:hypothetical protein
MEVQRQEDSAQAEFVQKQFDAFCSRVLETHTTSHLYQQLVLK